MLRSKGLLFIVVIMLIVMAPITTLATSAINAVEGSFFVQLEDIFKSLSYDSFRNKDNNSTLIYNDDDIYSFKDDGKISLNRKDITSEIESEDFKGSFISLNLFEQLKNKGSKKTVGDLLEKKKIYSAPTYNIEVFVDDEYMYVTKDESIESMTLQVKGQEYWFDLRKDVEVIPLLGKGDYEVSFLDHSENNLYSIVDMEDVYLEVNEDYSYHLSSSQPVYWGEYEINLSNEITKGLESDKEKAIAIYRFIVENMDYDWIALSANSIQTYPDNRLTVEKEAGVCFDFAALYAGLLRAQNIPTKLITGNEYRDEKYHAWNEVLIDGKWMGVDTTFDLGTNKQDIWTDMSNRTIIEVY